MHAPITFATGYDEITAHPYGILKGVVDGNAFVKGSWGAAIVDVLAPQTATSSSRANAASTRSRAPTSTSFCAARDHHDRARRFPHQLLRRVDHAHRVRERIPRLSLLNDCVAATSQEEHDNAISYDFPMFSMPVSAETVIAALSPSASDAA